MLTHVPSRHISIIVLLLSNYAHWFSPLFSAHLCMTAGLCGRPRWALYRCPPSVTAICSKMRPLTHAVPPRLSPPGAQKTSLKRPLWGADRFLNSALIDSENNWQRGWNFQLPPKIWARSFILSHQMTTHVKTNYSQKRHLQLLAESLSVFNQSATAHSYVWQSKARFHLCSLERCFCARKTALCFTQAMSCETDSELPGKYSLSQNTSHKHIACAEGGNHKLRFSDFSNKWCRVYRKWIFFPLLCCFPGLNTHL